MDISRKRLSTQVITIKPEMKTISSQTDNTGSKSVSLQCQAEVCEHSTETNDVQGEIEKLKAHINALNFSLFETEDAYNNLLLLKKCPCCKKDSGEQIQSVVQLDSASCAAAVQTDLIEEPSADLEKLLFISEQAEHLKSHCSKLEEEMEELKSNINNEKYTMDNQKYKQKLQLDELKSKTKALEKLNENITTSQKASQTKMMVLRSFILEQVHYNKSVYNYFLTSYKDKCKRVLWELRDLTALVTPQTTPTLSELNFSINNWTQSLGNATHCHSMILNYFEELNRILSVQDLDEPFPTKPLPEMPTEPPYLFSQYFKCVLHINSKLEQQNSYQNHLLWQKSTSESTAQNLQLPFTGDNISYVPSFQHQSSNQYVGMPHNSMQSPNRNINYSAPSQYQQPLPQPQPLRFANTFSTWQTPMQGVQAQFHSNINPIKIGSPVNMSPMQHPINYPETTHNQTTYTLQPIGNHVTTPDVMRKSQQPIKNYEKLTSVVPPQQPIKVDSENQSSVTQPIGNQLSTSGLKFSVQQPINEDDVQTCITQFESLIRKNNATSCVTSEEHHQSTHYQKLQLVNHDNITHIAMTQLQPPISDADTKLESMDQHQPPISDTVTKLGSMDQHQPSINEKHTHSLVTQLESIPCPILDHNDDEKILPSGEVGENNVEGNVEVASDAKLKSNSGTDKVTDNKELNNHSQITHLPWRLEQQNLKDWVSTYGKESPEDSNISSDDKNSKYTGVQVLKNKIEVVKPNLDETAVSNHNKSSVALPPTAAPDTSPKPSESKGLDAIKAALQKVYPTVPTNQLLDAVAELRQREGKLTGMSIKAIRSGVQHILMANQINKSVDDKNGKSPWAKLDNSHLEWQKDNFDENCSICFEFMDKKRKIELRCQHSFHLNCIKLWLQTNSICPICRIFTRLDDEFPPLK